MKVEIWSDITCTFCYTAKQIFDSAISLYRDKDKIGVVWKSFELAPELKTDDSKYLPEFLAGLKGISIEQARDMTDYLTNAVKEVGLVYNLNKTIPANSFNAHRLSHLAKEHHLQSEAEERLFKAYFTEGKNIDDLPTLIELGGEIGLDTNEVKTVLESEKYAREVSRDIDEGKQAGVRSVPFFVFNRKTTITGVQKMSLFLETLESTFAEWQLENEPTPGEISEAEFCEIGEDC